MEMKVDTVTRSGNDCGFTTLRPGNPHGIGVDTNLVITTKDWLAATMEHLRTPTLDKAGEDARREFLNSLRDPNSGIGIEVSDPITVESVLE